MLPCTCREAMSCVYFGDKNNFIMWILTEILALVVVTSFTIAHISSGTELTQADVIFIALAIGACIMAIIVTIICRLSVRARHSKAGQKSWQGSWCCFDNNVNSRVKFVRRKMGSDCAICLEEKNVTVKQVVEITCKHTYHQACISKCMETDKTAKCPQCRQTMGQFPTTERFVAFIRSLVKKNERTIRAKATRC